MLVLLVAFVGERESGGMDLPGIYLDTHSACVCFSVHFFIYHFLTLSDITTKIFVKGINVSYMNYQSKMVTTYIELNNLQDSNKFFLDLF